MDDRENRIMRELAARYAEEYGRRLNRERAEIEAANPPAPLGLERKVREKVYGTPRPKHRRRMTAFAALAACLVLLLLAPYILRVNRSGTAPAADSEGAGQAAPEDGEGAVPAMPDGSDQPGDAAPGNAEGDAAGAAGERIELNFALPTYLTVRDVALDDGKTVYYLDSARLDDVVLTLEEISEPLDHSEMTAHSINGSPAWSRSEPEYHLLTFEQDGVEYVMTCRHELETLLELAAFIL